MKLYVMAFGAATGAVSVVYIYRKFWRQTLEKKAKSDDSSTGGKKTVGYFTKYVLVPKGTVGLILGRHGRNARQLEFETKTFTQVCYYNEKEILHCKSRDPFSQWDTRFEDDAAEEWGRPAAVKRDASKADKVAFIKIQGKTLPSVELAICKIEAIVDDWQRNNAVSQLKIPKEAVGFVIGKHGHNMKMVSQMCRVHANVQRQENPDCEFETMTIRGTEEGVDAAVTKFKASIQRFYLMRQEEAEEEKITQFGPPEADSRGIYENLAAELDDLDKLKQLMEEDLELW